MTWWMLSCPPRPDVAFAALGEWPDLNGVNWLGASSFTVPIPDPLEVTLDPGHPGLVAPLYDAGIVLFSVDLVDALWDCGVDNLDTYPAVIVDPTTGERHLTHRAVNVLGAVGCADLGRSQARVWGAPVIDVDFDSLVIDPDRAMDLSLFRLAECVTGLVVHDRVKRHLERIPTLSDLGFTRPEDWIG